jgi:DNA-binding NarL/FixJ family response regulator
MPDLAATSRVLVVDDSPDALFMLTDALTLEGMDVLTCNNGRQAISLANTSSPDIVLMDAVMPGLDGFQTCQILKAERGFEDVPIIFMTGFNESEHVVRALAAGGVDFISKPIELNELFARMRVHLGNARRARSARRALDSTGRWIVACDRNGRIHWSTQQAADLMQRAGIRSDQGAYLPWEVVEMVGLAVEQVSSAVFGHALRYSRHGQDLEFRMLSDGGNDEMLLRLVDRHRGTDEEQLAKAFGLTLREADVLLWIAHGKANKEIADILEMSPRTVNKHLDQIFNKLSVEKRTSAATMAVKVLWRDS